MVLGVRVRPPPPSQNFVATPLDEGDRILQRSRGQSADSCMSSGEGQAPRRRLPAELIVYPRHVTGAASSLRRCAKFGAPRGSGSVSGRLPCVAAAVVVVVGGAPSVWLWIKVKTTRPDESHPVSCICYCWPSSMVPAAARISSIGWGDLATCVGDRCQGQGSTVPKLNGNKSQTRLALPRARSGLYIRVWP